jgi:uncharacterized protein
MLIELSTVGSTPKPLQATCRSDEIDLEDDGELVGEASFNGELFKEQEKVHLRGTITADVAIACARCLEPVSVHIDEPFKDVFVDASEETTAEEAELAEPDLDESLVIGGTVDLAEAIREQIILALPEMVLCKEECKGLCPKCGSNRNLIDCSCDRDELDPRWAALRDLKF